MDLIEQAIVNGVSTLSEHDSKRFLSSYGIPIVREIIAPEPETAAIEAERIGFPIALKVSGNSLTHKTELGGVVLNLKNKDEVRVEGHRLLGIKGCEGLLVQEMVSGARELSCGLIRDDQFGPCVMFGLGGTLIEIIEDITFRVSPLTHLDAMEMLWEIQGSRVLGPFRGELAADINMLAQLLISLGEAGLQNKDVLEIDINPLKIRPNGKPVAVDALVVIKPTK